MKYFPLFLLLSLYSCDTETIEEIWDDGSPKIVSYEINRYTKEEIHYYESGVKKEQGIVQGNLRIGDWKAWHGTGRLKHRIFYRAGIPFGDYKKYDSGGRIQEKGSFDLAGENVGEYASYFVDGKLEKRGEFKSGKKIGDWVNYESLGEREVVESFFRNGCLKERKGVVGENNHIKIEKWYRCDVPSLIGYHKFEQKDSTWIEFWEFGGIKSEGNYKLGEKTGVWTYNFEHGLTEEVIKYSEKGMKYLEYWEHDKRFIPAHENGIFVGHNSKGKYGRWLYKEGVVVKRLEFKDEK